MTIVGERLAAAQLDGHRAIDAVYRELAQAVYDAVLRHGTLDAGGVLRLTLADRFAILTEIGRLIDQAGPELRSAIVEAVKAAEAAAQVGFDPLPVDLTVILGLFATVPTSLQRNRANVISQTGALLVQGLAGNYPARTVAGWVQQYFSPFFAPRRDEGGRLLRADRLGAVRFWPGRAGMASQHARLVMLDQASAAHGRTMVRLARRDDFLLRYHVSHKHLEIDECDRLGQQDVGFGPGIYPADQFPSLPRHRRCRCYGEPAERPRFLARSESMAV